MSYTANLTPDPETGLGKWTQRNFTETIRTGRHMGRGRQILPPMPIPMYKNFTDADLEAIFSYLQTIPAVKNRVPGLALRELLTREPSAPRHRSTGAVRGGAVEDPVHVNDPSVARRTSPRPHRRRQGRRPRCCSRTPTRRSGSGSAPAPSGYGCQV